MSQQDNPQDSPDTSSSLDAASWSTPSPASNRPAEGATRVASLQQAEQTWRASESATDFLGLEQDAAPEAPIAAPAAETPGATGSTEVNPTQAWLFHMENEARSGLEPQAAAPQPIDAPAPEWSAESLLAGQDTSPVLEDPALLQSVPAPGFEDSLAPSSDSPAELQPQLAGEVAPPAAKRRKVQWLVAAGLAATLLAAGGYQVWNSRTKSQNSSTNDPLVWRSGNKTPKPQKPKVTPPVEKPAETPSVAQQPPNEIPPADPVTQPVEVAVAPPPSEPVVPTEPVAQTTPPVETPAPAPVEPVAQVQPDPIPAPPDLTPVAFPGLRPSDPIASVPTPKGTRRPGSSELAGMWSEADLPSTEAIDSEAIVRTPLVGAVRLLLKNGEHLQGRLHSVGQGHVSMDMTLGRMSIEFADVSEMLKIQDADLSKKPSNGLPSETAGLMYITAKVPGGYLTGWLVQRAEGKLTLITEQAKKITVEDAGYEPVSKGRARIVGALTSGAAEATPTPVPASNTNGKPRGGAPAPKSAKPAAKPNPAKPKG